MLRGSSRGERVFRIERNVRQFRIERHVRSGSNVTFAYLQKILVDGEAIGAVVQAAVFGQIIFDILAGWWPADG